MLTKHFFLDQHGCAKNQVDGEILIGILNNLGWEKTDAPDEASLIIVNSCGFIEPAKVESIDAVITARAAYPNAKILLAGCLAERYGDDFKDDFLEADAFFGNGDLSRLPAVIDTLFPQKKEPKYRLPAHKQCRPFLKPPQIGVCGGFRPDILNFPRSAFIKITEGCNNDCTFCAIPLIRGNVRSRSVAAIITEIEGFVKKGYKEFNLIGQDLAVFHADTKDAHTVSGLAHLLRAISNINGDFFVRLLYIHPDHFPLDILPIMTADSRFLPYFDIPFQSGSKDIIHAMNRTGTPEGYLSLVQAIKDAFRNADSPYGQAAIRTTFLTGFPGETDRHFEETAAFLHSLHSLWSGVFVYSKEEGTKAADMRHSVPVKKAEVRKKILMDIQSEITQELLESFCGQEMPVLIEEIIPKAEQNEDEGRLALGRSWFQAPEVDGSVVVNFSEDQKDTEGDILHPGSVVYVKITAVRGVDVEAVAISKTN